MIRRVLMLPISRSFRRAARAVVVGVTSAAVVLGSAVSAVPAVAAPAEAAGPLAEVAATSTAAAGPVFIASVPFRTRVQN